MGCDSSSPSPVINPVNQPYFQNSKDVIPVKQSYKKHNQIQIKKVVYEQNPYNNDIEFQKMKGTLQQAQRQRTLLEQQNKKLLKKFKKKQKQKQKSQANKIQKKPLKLKDIASKANKHVNNKVEQIDKKMQTIQSLKKQRFGFVNQLKNSLKYYQQKLSQLSRQSSFNQKRHAQLLNNQEYLEDPVEIKKSKKERQQLLQKLKLLEKSCIQTNSQVDGIRSKFRSIKGQIIQLNNQYEELIAERLIVNT